MKKKGAVEKEVNSQVASNELRKKILAALAESEEQALLEANKIVDPADPQNENIETTELEERVIRESMIVAIDPDVLNEGQVDLQKMDVPIRVIQPGISKNGNWHHEDRLQESVMLLENVPIWNDHKAKHDPKDRLGTVTKPFWEGMPKAIARFLPGTGKWVYENAMADPTSVEFSINAAVEGKWITHEKQKVFDVTNYLEYKSVDVVAEASAGGGVDLKVSESVENKEVDKMEVKLIESVEQLKADYPVFVSGLRKEFEKELSESAEQKAQEKRLEEAEKSVQEVSDFLAGKELSESVKENGVIGCLENVFTELSGAKKTIDEFETAEKIKEDKALVDRLLVESKLDEKDDKEVSENFKSSLFAIKGEDREAKIKEAIADREAFIANVKAKVTGNGKPEKLETGEPIVEGLTEEQEKKVIEAFKRE